MSDPLTFWLIGRGIGYSASPAMMTAAFRVLGLPHRYLLADVDEHAVAATIATLRAADVGGANVTVPYKATAAGLVDEVSDVAHEADAVNTVVRDGDRLIGHNTDMPATIEAIVRLCPGGVSHALILGAGGVSRAARLALVRTGAGQVTVLRRADRSLERLPDAIASADLLVNATPVGTGSDESLVAPELLRPDLAVLDLVYRPSPTRLVRDALAAGAAAESGAGILLGQAWRALELWLGREAPVEVMRAALDAELAGPAHA
ncbi:MAG: shikimate dehydrogenase [Chloroflexota bacterium]|jgi:shikimate dehydrogenase